MGRFVALLRGINVGGNKKVPMPVLKKVFEANGFANVRTLLASGNVVFEGNKSTLHAIPAALERTFKFPIDTIVVPLESVTEIVRADPFKGIPVTTDTRLYVTFLAKAPPAWPKFPVKSADGALVLLGRKGLAVFSVLEVGKTGTPEAMVLLEKTFGKSITTRNYNTVVKIAGM
jgi:uncharacterized protein (DUF1697 family)